MQLYDELKTLKLRNLTMKTMVCSVQRVVVGDDRISMNSGKVWRKGIRRFVRFQSPLDVGLLQDDKEIKKSLPSHSMGSEVVGIGGIGMNSDEVFGVLRGIERRREGQRRS
jgi:hypothetical protein